MFTNTESPQCQKKDWSIHKIICKEYTKFIAKGPRPSNTDNFAFRLVLSFPVFSKKPKFVWVGNDSCGIGEDETQFTEIVNTDMAGDDAKAIVLNKTLDPSFEIDHGVHFWGNWESIAADDGVVSWMPFDVSKEENESIKGILKEDYRDNLKGVFLLVSDAAPVGGHPESTTFQDISLADFRLAIQYLQTQDASMKFTNQN